MPSEPDARISSGLTTIKMIEISRIFALLIFFCSSPNTSADGSSEAAIKNCATPSAVLPPPWLFTSETRKLLIGITPIMPKKQAMSMSVKTLFFFKICQIEWPEADFACGCGRRRAGMLGNASRQTISRSCSAQCARSAACIPNRAVSSPVTTHKTA